MAGFTTCESIKVLTQNGECEIELCLGDITRLAKKDKVDVLMVSAFVGKYAELRIRFFVLFILCSHCGNKP